MTGTDYFSNHAMKLRFPWRLYHRPIARELAAEIERRRGGRVLNVGSGPFLELPTLPRDGVLYTVADIDPRAIELARELHGDTLAGADVLEPGEPLPYPDGAFDLVAAMDVIEHVSPPEPWLRELWRVVSDGGALFLTTPNYGSRSLRLLEATALEIVARSQGFSRREIHPTKLDRRAFARMLSTLDGRSTTVRSISFGWVLVGRVEKAGRLSRAPSPGASGGPSRPI